MSTVLIYILLCLLAAKIASDKGRSGTGFFLLSFFLSPIVGLLAVCIARTNEAKSMLASGCKKCPDCAEYIKREAKVCRHCGLINV